MANHQVPTISVTPQSPGSKYNHILEDSLNHLQHIRDTIQSISSSSNCRKSTNASLLSDQLMLSSLRQFATSLPDISKASQNHSTWPGQSIVRLNIDRRKSWTAIEDLSECTKSSHKSVSLSSLDSEEHDDHLRINSSSNPAGISTYSLNDAEFIRNFERTSLNSNISSLIQSRIPLQKSISTPSIAPLRALPIKDELPIAHHLSDSDNDNADDNSILCSAAKGETYIDGTEKRRKRGSLFFRKKKDKSKTKGQTTICDGCGCTINPASIKEHISECKGKHSKQQQIKNAYKKISHNSHSSTQHHHHHTADALIDVHDGHIINSGLINYSDDTPLINNEFLVEPHINHHSLGGDPILGMSREHEHDSWSPNVGKDIVKSLTAKEVKRQEHIYELIITEKRHCQILLLMQKVFVESLQRHFSHLNLERLFPRLQELTDLHSGFLKQLRLKQNESLIVDSVADILLHFFSGLSAQRLKNCYGEFCSNHQSAVDTFKFYQNGDRAFSEWHKHKQTNPLLKRKGIPECTLFVVQRLTKYPILIEDQLKLTKNTAEYEKLHQANVLIKEILINVNSQVAEKENDDRHLDIFKRIDAKSSTFYKGEKFKKSDIMGVNRKLRFEGQALLMQGRAKMQPVNIVVLSDCLFFLVENSTKYSFFKPDNKAGVVSLHKLLIREKARESHIIYIISSDPSNPEMYELEVQNPKDKNMWIQSIRAAVLSCHSDNSEANEYLTEDQKLSMAEAKQAALKEIIGHMRLKDVDQAILLEQKLALQVKFFRETGIHRNFDETCGSESLIPNFGSYKGIVSENCDTVELSKLVLEKIQETSNLAASLYSSATGQDLPMRSFNSAIERHSDLYQTPRLPTRAETFGGFDEKKNKTLPPWRDALISTINNTISVHSKDNLTNTSELDKTATNNAQTLSQDKALVVFHNLNTFMCIINQQMTTINSLQNSLQDNPKHLYRHNDQLEELRNLQDKFQEEKTVWLKQKESQEKAMDERQLKQEVMLEQIRRQQDDLEQQREQWFRKMEKMEKLANQQIANVSNYVVGNNVEDSCFNKSTEESATVDVSSLRRKDKRNTSTVLKLASSNAPTISGVRQQLPLKLSSSIRQPEMVGVTNSVLSPTNVSQILPFKLADKKNSLTGVGSHTRTGSSPAIIQNQNTPTGHSARTNTYPMRYRLRSADAEFATDSPCASNSRDDRLSHTLANSTVATDSTTKKSEEAKYPFNQEEIYF